MSARTQRGRAARAKKQSRALLYGVIAGVILIGLVIAAVALNPGSTTTSTGGTGATGGTVALDEAKLATFASKGSADAPVTVVEFADFQCPGCAYFATQMAANFQKTYVDTGKVRFIYHEMPLRSHANAVPAAEAARAAGEQGKFWEMHDLLFANQAQWANLANPTDQFTAYAQQLGLDTAAFKQVLTSGKYKATLQEAYNEGATIGIPATPSFVVDGKIVGADQLTAAVDQALAK